MNKPEKQKEITIVMVNTSQLNSDDLIQFCRDVLLFIASLDEIKFAVPNKQNVAFIHIMKSDAKQEIMTHFVNKPRRITTPAVGFFGQRGTNISSKMQPVSVATLTEAYVHSFAEAQTTSDMDKLIMLTMHSQLNETHEDNTVPTNYVCPINHYIQRCIFSDLFFKIAYRNSYFSVSSLHDYSRYFSDFIAWRENSTSNCYHLRQEQFGTVKKRPSDVVSLVKKFDQIHNDYFSVARKITSQDSHLRYIGRSLNAKKTTASMSNRLQSLLMKRTSPHTEDAMRELDKTMVNYPSICHKIVVRLHE